MAKTKATKIRELDVVVEVAYVNGVSGASKLVGYVKDNDLLYYFDPAEVSVREVAAEVAWLATGREVDGVRIAGCVPSRLNTGDQVPYYHVTLA